MSPWPVGTVEELAKQGGPYFLKDVDVQPNETPMLDNPDFVLSPEGDAIWGAPPRAVSPPIVELIAGDRDARSCGQVLRVCNELDSGVRRICLALAALDCELIVKLTKVRRRIGGAGRPETGFVVYERFAIGGYRWASRGNCMTHTSKK